MDPGWIVVIILLSGFVCFLLLSTYRFIRLPRSNPISYLKRSKTGSETSLTKILLIGDSITHGTVSANYVDLVVSGLNADPAKKTFEALNAGINGEFTYNVLQRLDPIIQCAPNVITILIGTNDAYGSFTPERQRKQMRKWKLPELPDENNYRGYLTAVVTKLKTNSRAHIGLLSIPTIGEDPTTREFAQSRKYSEIIKEVAGAIGVAYLPLNEAMVNYLQIHPSSQKFPFKWYLFAIVKSILAHAFGKSWEKVASANGFKLHTDHLHLSPNGATMVADLITKFYKGSV